MEEKKKARNKYAVMLVKESDSGVITNHHIGTTLCEAVLIALFLIFVFCFCKLIYDSVVIKNLKNQLIEQMVMVNNLTDENESLTVENDTLTSKVAVLSETVTKKTVTEDTLSQEETENALPKGFPLNGSATMESDTLDDRPIVKFVASAGINVVSSGSGTVLSVEDDATYGTRIIIDHGNGYRSIYRNKGDVLVRNGETLVKGYPLFSISDNNKDIGYQIMLDEEYIDPMTVMEING